ncbi:MAG: hypothetical protein OXU69_00410 [Gemmatimonadota bacterium]|nr:hypothetical protein [Gemmatimonadota bacterium]
MHHAVVACMSVFLLVGCDRFPGPVVRNEFPTVAHITVSYSDGETWTLELPSCHSVHLGAVEVGRWGLRPQEGVFIDEVVVEVEGDVVHRIEKTVIDRFIEKASEQQDYPVWAIDRSGIRFAAETECALPQGS